MDHRHEASPREKTRPLEPPATRAEDESTLVDRKGRAGGSEHKPTLNDEATQRVLLDDGRQNADSNAPRGTSDESGTDAAGFEPTLLPRQAPPAGETDRRDARWPHVPGYEILSCLGQGGMGVVYLARQESLGRVVALKMLVAGQLAAEDLLARFHVEAESVARLQHPHIVQIYETGEVAGQPYFSLEYVSGGSLADQLDGTPQDPRYAARMVSQLADAAGYAHQSRILHRDLKPANVLLEQDGTPKITDFGLAKQLESDSKNTRTGDVLGTPSYMAPEQASGVTKKLSPACDIYSLGAVLYEMLVGRPPFRGRDAVDTLMQVLSDEPVTPRRLQPQIPRDLETICLKCLEKSPGKRYGSAIELADDLRRFLHSEPILARPIRRWERAAKFARRRPSLAALVFVSVLATVILVGGSVWHAARLKRFNTQLAAAYHQQKETIDAALDYVDRTIRSASGNRLAPLPQSDRTRREMLDSAMWFCDRLLQQNSNDPDVRLHAARAQRQLADMHQLVGEVEKAQRAYRRAIGMLATLHDEWPTRLGPPRELAAAHLNFGNLLERLARPSDAEAEYRLALPILEHLTEPFAERIDDVQLLASTHGNLGVVLEQMGRGTEAEAEHREATRLLLAIVERAPASQVSGADLAVTLSNTGILLRSRGRLDAAAKAFREALDALHGAAANSPENRLATASAWNNLATIEQLKGRSDEALASYRKAAAVFDGLLENSPDTVHYLTGWAENRNNLALLLESGGELEAARKMLEHTAERLAGRVARNPREPAYRDSLATTRYGQSLVANRLGQRREAEDRLSETLRLRRGLAEAFPDQLAYRSRLAAVLHRTAEMLIENKRFGDAVTTLYEAVDLQQAVVDADHHQVAYRDDLRRYYLALADALVAAEEPAQASRVADQIARLFGDNAESYLHAAGVLAHCIALITSAKGGDGSPAEGVSLRDYCVERVVAMLREAASRGYLDLNTLKTSPRFDALRDKVEFQKLLDQLQQSTQDRAAGG